VSLYDDLGIDKDASQDEIKAALRKAVRQHNPDAGGDLVLYAVEKEKGPMRWWTHRAFNRNQ